MVEEMYNSESPRGEYGEINRMIISLAVVLSDSISGIYDPWTSERSHEIGSSLLRHNHVNKIRLIFPIFMPFALRETLRYNGESLFLPPLPRYLLLWCDFR